MATIKKGPGKPNAVPVGSKNALKGNSPPKAKTPRSTTRYVEVKIRLTREEFDRGQPYFENEKYLGRFVLEAYKEKVNRSAANDKADRLRVLANNMELLLPVIAEMHQQGKLDFLFAKQEGNKND
jgi:hypothetical protein